MIFDCYLLKIFFVLSQHVFIFLRSLEELSAVGCWKVRSAARHSAADIMAVDSMQTSLQDAGLDSNCKFVVEVTDTQQRDVVDCISLAQAEATEVAAQNSEHSSASVRNVDDARKVKVVDLT